MTVRQPSVARAIARRVVLLLLGSCVLQLLVTVWVVSRVTPPLRQQHRTLALRLARMAAEGGARSDQQLASELGDLGPVVVLYDAQGRIAARSRADASLPRRLSKQQRQAARANPRRPVWLEPDGLLNDRIAILYVPGTAGARYVGIVDRWTPGRVKTALIWGLGLGLLSAFLIGITAIGWVTRRSRRMLARGETLMQKMAEGDLSVRLTEKRNDEFGRLARSFNQMAETLTHQVQRTEAMEANRSRAFADWTHEMATPLSSVLGYLESLHTQEHDAETRRQYVETAYHGALALRRLSEDLTTLSQVEFEGHRLDLGPVDLKEIAERERAAMAPQAAAKQLELSLQEVTPIGIITADGDRLAQVLRNLLSNAIRHTQPGRSVLIRLSEADSRSVELAVIDEGEGIPAEHLDQVGQPFYRVDKSRARATGGRGLGLAITKSLVEAHGGSVHIESTEGSGTVVRIVLPRVAEPGRSAR